jgi:hypothetical protein
MTTGLDYATPLNASGLRDAVAEGHAFVLRYGPPSIYKMSFGECDAIRASGLRVGHIFQVQADRALRGAATGSADGAQLDAWATDCGAPMTCRLIYVAADFDATLAQLRGPIAEYARAFDQACRRPTMPYGPYTTLEVLCGELGIAPYGWQAAGFSGSGSGSGGSFRCNDGSVRRLSKYAAMFQDVAYVLGNRADLNHVLREPVDWAWPLVASPPPPSPEEDYAMKCVFTEQTGGIGWRAVEIDGRRYREGYSSREDLDLDLATGLVDGEVTLTGAAGQRFLDRYPSIVPPAGPVLVRPAPGSTWATEVADLPAGTTATFVLYPSGVIVPVKTDRQADVDRYVGVRDLGEVADEFLYNGVLMPWSAAGRTVELEVGDWDPTGLKVGLTPEAVSQVAEAVNDEAHARSEN